MKIRSSRCCCCCACCITAVDLGRPMTGSVVCGRAVGRRRRRVAGLPGHLLSLQSQRRRHVASSAAAAVPSFLIPGPHYAASVRSWPNRLTDHALYNYADDYCNQQRSAPSLGGAECTLLLIEYTKYATYISVIYSVT